MIYFHFRDAGYLRDVVSKVRLSEKKTKRILSFLEREYLKTKFKGSANREKCKINYDLFSFPRCSLPKRRSLKGTNK